MWRTTWMLAVVASCAYTYATAPHFCCVLTGIQTCDELPMGSLTWVYSRSISVTCFVSCLMVWVKCHGGAAEEYGARVTVHDPYSPTTDADRRAYAMFNAAVVSACAVLVLPANGTRVFMLYEMGQSAGVMVFFGLMYVHNAVTCLSETRFVFQCYVLYGKFDRINRDMEAIGDQIHGGHWMLDASDMYCSRATGQRLVDAVERLKIRHRLMREAVDELHDVFAVPMGFSLCNLCVMALYDIYYQLLNVYVQPTVTLPNLFVVAWLIQYSFRFFIIVKMVHSMMQQALGISTTYLVILLQLKSKLNNDGL